MVIVTASLSNMIVDSRVKLRNKRIADAKDDYKWQTDPELSKLDASPLLTINYSQYLSEYAFELCSPSSTRKEFAVETLEGKHVGNCVYYGIDGAKGEAELGVMIGDPDYWDKGYGTDAVNALINYIFSQTKLNRIHLKTLDWNIRAQNCFKKCGFKQNGHLVRDEFSFLLMEMYRFQWQKQTAEKET